MERLEKIQVYTPEAPKPGGPYSQVKYQNYYFPIQVYVSICTYIYPSLNLSKNPLNQKLTNKKIITDVLGAQFQMLTKFLISTS